MGVVELTEERPVDCVKEFDPHLLGVLFDLKNFEKSIGSLGSTIFLLVASKNLFNVLFGEIRRIDTTRNGVIGCKLVLDHLMLEVLREKDHHTVRKGVTVVNLHLTLDAKLSC